MFTISIVSDVVCLWCFIGTRRLAAAVEMVRARHPDFRHATHWRPFFLNPEIIDEVVKYVNIPKDIAEGVRQFAKQKAADKTKTELAAKKAAKSAVKQSGNTG